MGSSRVLSRLNIVFVVGGYAKQKDSSFFNFVKIEQLQTFKLCYKNNGGRWCEYMSLGWIFCQKFWIWMELGGSLVRVWLQIYRYLKLNSLPTHNLFDSKLMLIIVVNFDQWMSVVHCFHEKSNWVAFLLDNLHVLRTQFIISYKI